LHRPAVDGETGDGDLDGLGSLAADGDSSVESSGGADSIPQSAEFIRAGCPEILIEPNMLGIKIEYEESRAPGLSIEVAGTG
tara:strand:+ start:546 stop:791 length:246 start_codon:yes stop_codon:yes gene_type:complete